MGKKGGFFLIVFLVLLMNLVPCSGGSNEVQAEVGFTISTSIAIIVLRDNFNASTTDFTSLGNAGLGNISDMTLEVGEYGKIVFTEIVNLTKDAHSPTGGLHDRTVDLDSHVFILSNYIYINSTNLTSLNKSARLSLYNLTFTNPQILKGGVACSECSEISYIDGTFVFDVNNFDGYYSVGETPTGTVDAPSSAGPLSRGSSVISYEIYDFYPEPDLLSLIPKPMDIYQKNIILTNNGTKNLEIEVEIENLGGMIVPEVKSFNLRSRESRAVLFNISIPNEPSSDIYLGKIHFNSYKVNRTVDVVIGISESALFDFEVKVLKEYVYPGDRVPAEIKIINLGEGTMVNIEIVYSLLDFNRNTINTKTEKEVLKNSLTKRVYLETPTDIAVGNYVFYSKVSYQGKSASSYDTFEVKKFPYWILIIIIIIIVVAIIFLVRKNSKR